MSEQAIKYEQLVQSYENRLLNQLRSHGVDLDFLGGFLTKIRSQASSIWPKLPVHRVSRVSFYR